MNSVNLWQTSFNEKEWSVIQWKGANEDKETKICMMLLLGLEETIQKQIDVSELILRAEEKETRTTDKL